ncbi:glycoside hydrolase family 27 protein [Amycolatopsis sp. CA-230715]|uniref:glycoside hydrolase family 27 protein n=1 Tax=Amycolatopsis sp. CA-230715 TaxID=2745196 RepID=UPI001C33AE16|nr:glycoside hydrolase family 27 protein [Amycolatopsis sp. CA-230715]QWF82820.1 Alpha-galactosidase A [Amycolatopsis sp. CA-230715]
MLVLAVLAAALTWASPLPEPPLANGLARTPPMGWNSWNQTRCYGLTERAVREAADALVRTGMRDAGYRYVVVDDCWQDFTRGARGELRANPQRFPGGIAALAEYVHRRGLLFGIYSVPGSSTCAMANDGYPAHGIGSLGHERQDAETFAAWGVDYLKYDWCDADTNDGLQRQPAFEKMRDELARTNRKILYSISEYGVSSPWTWARPVANLWRTTYDLTPDWASISSVIEQQAAVAAYSGAPGGWNDPDMLQLGNGALTADEARAHFSLWAMLNAPLFAGTDLGALSTSDIQTLTNPEVLALDQDFAGSQGRKIAGTATTDVWRKPLSGGGYAVALLNRGDAGTRMSARTPGQWRIRDLWAHQDVGGTEFSVPAHGVRVLMLRP